MPEGDAGEVLKEIAGIPRKVFRKKKLGRNFRMSCLRNFYEIFCKSCQKNFKEIAEKLQEKFLNNNAEGISKCRLNFFTMCIGNSLNHLCEEGLLRRTSRGDPEQFP